MARLSPLLDVLEAAGARLEERDGWLVAADLGDLAGEYAAARDGSAVADRSARGFLRVHGRDAAKLLQSIVTNDVEALGEGESAFAFLLTPRGRPLADLRVVRTGADAFLLDCEAPAHDVVALALRRYRLAAQAQIEDAREAVAAVAVFGVEDLPGEDGLVRVPSLLGVDLVGDAPAVRAAWDRLVAGGARPIGAEAYEALRVVAGVPRLGWEIDESVLPAETGLVERAVSFTKGCYIGQEPVARLHYRGHANRTLRRLVLDDGAAPDLPASVATAGKDVGRVTSAVVPPDASGAPVALAYVRREVPDGARVEVRDAGERTLGAVVEPLPVAVTR
jgi:aminomethyltransferase